MINKVKNPETYSVCKHCPYYKSVADYEIEIKAYGEEEALKCKYERICGSVLRFSVVQTL